ncbi:4-hydroxyphenylpyruvate_dioxygenase [Candidozyma auris]|uniref:4-hydroxyphenylpyruvate_dioxygenase n=1 Tax=Candidozyma auris TaxID=498019 RepID=UPI000D29CBEA|nr:4-hydroxyphenylpyruvate_dioxygenase [[Candida] auris]QEO23803.1 4-hydroxyphenylpyruvate_dioxygenase [[Candida] auris]GBL52907.1 putative 4-hydroxyphenylpyruvate dioxygenase [[Candida] auris]
MQILKELPFYPHHGLKVKVYSKSDFEIAELLRGGHSTHKLPLDGLLGFHAIRFATSNAKEMARFLELSLGFKEIAYRGLETSSIVLASHVLKKGDCVFEVINTLSRGDSRPNSSKSFSSRSGSRSREMLPVTLMVHGGATSFEELGRAAEQLAYDALDAKAIDTFVNIHGMGVMDVSLDVLDVNKAFLRATGAGATIVRRPTVITDEFGSVKVAVIRIPGSDLRHTLVENLTYKGPFMPFYKESMVPSLPEENPVPLIGIDHCVQNFTWNQMDDYAMFYAAAFGLHKFWSVDEQDVSTGATALKSVVMASANGKVKMPINEPAKGIMKGQIEEFYEFYKGPGVQHIALITRDIIASVKAMRLRGIDFNTISDAYYKNLEERLNKDSIKLFESFEELKALHILVDFDSASKYLHRDGSYRCHYILQIFTKPLHDRPTLFLEIIQRHHHNGFGKGTFKGLFETIEAQQRLRGTLVPSALM